MEGKCTLYTYFYNLLTYSITFNSKLSKSSVTCSSNYVILRNRLDKIKRVSCYKQMYREDLRPIVMLRNFNLVAYASFPSNQRIPNNF